MTSPLACGLSPGIFDPLAPGREVAAFRLVLSLWNAGFRDNVSTNEFPNTQSLHELTAQDPPDREPIADQGQPVFPRGDLTAAEGPAPAGAATGEPHPYGPNNEQLPEELQDALRDLVSRIAEESETARRQEIRQVKQAHYFWRGLQYLWWNDRPFSS